MNNENHSINNVKINISSNKKATNLHASVKDFFENKIKPFLIAKMDSLDQSINLSINQLSIDLGTLTVVDLNNISLAEEEELISHFKQQFDAKLRGLIPTKPVTQQMVDVIKKALKRGFIPGLDESKRNRIDLELILDELSNSEARELHLFLIKNKKNEIIIHRFLQQFKPKQIESFFARLNPNILLSIKELNRVFNLNQAVLLITKSEFQQAVKKHFISNKVSDGGNVNEIVSYFFEYKLNILLEELELQVQGEKLLSISKERGKYFKERVKKYDQLINELIRSVTKAGGLTNVSKEEWIFLFQNFLLESSNNSARTSQLVKLFMETRHSSILSERTPLTNQDVLEFKFDVLETFWQGRKGSDIIAQFINTGSFPLQLNAQSESAILSLFLAFTQKYPFQIRRALLAKTTSWLWDLLKRLSEQQLEKFVHVFSPNFLFEKTGLFNMLEGLVKDGLVEVINMNALKEEFNSTSLKRLIYRKETYFKPTKGLFSQWVVLGKVTKNAGFNQHNLESSSFSKTARLLLKELDSPTVIFNPSVKGLEFSIPEMEAQIQMDFQPREAILDMFLAYAKKHHLQLRKVLTAKKTSELWSLLDRFNQEQFEQFVHVFAPNFLLEKTGLFNMLEGLVKDGLVEVINMNALKKEFNSTTLKRLIYRKETDFKPTKGLFSQWVVLGKVTKNDGFDQHNWESSSFTKTARLLLKELDSPVVIFNPGGKGLEFSIPEMEAQLQMDFQPREAILDMFLAFAKKHPLQLRKVLTAKKTSELWNLLDRFNQEQFEQFVHVFAPNFLLEKTGLFNMLEGLVKDGLVEVINMNALKKEFNSTTLKRLIYRKETHFKPTKALFSQWVVLGKVFNNESFNSGRRKGKGISSFDSVRMLIEALEETKQPIELQKKQDKVENKNTVVSLGPAFYSNILSHYILFNELPWWGIMQLRNAEGKGLSIQKGNQIVQVQLLISQFKKSHNIYYVKFINFIRQTSKLLRSLIYTIDNSIFNFLLQDFISTNSTVQLKLFLEELNLVTLFLLDSSINIKNAQNSIVFHLINSNNEKSLESIFDHILEDFLSNYKASRNILNVISSQNLTSHYFNSKRVEEMLKLALNVKSEIASQSLEAKPNLGQNNYLLSNILHVNLMGELIDFFKTGILIGSLSNDKEGYLSFVKEGLANSRYRKLILGNLKKSAFPLEYFLFNARIQTDGRDLEELAEETNLRGEESEEMTLTELDEIGEQNEIELPNELVIHKKSIELNLAIFKYFIYNNELPWWSPFENLKTFQIQFILLFNENRAVFFKDLELFFSDNLIGEKMISFYNFQLNEPNKIDQLADGVIKELITIIRQIWPANKKTRALIVQLSEIKLLMYYDLTTTAQTSAITLLFEYTIRYVWIELTQKWSQFVNQIKTLVTSINRNFNLSIEIGLTFNELEEWVRENKNETGDGFQTSKIGKSQLDKKGVALPRNLTELDSDFYSKLVSLGRNKLNEDDRRIPGILLLTKPFVMANDYEYYQGVILDLVEAFNPIQKSSDALKVFNLELIKVLHGLLTQNGAYKSNELTKKILEQLSADQGLEQEWIYEIQLQLSDYESSFQNELTANTTIINEISGVLKEIYPAGIEDNIHILSQFFVSRAGLSKYNRNSTVLSFMHYLSLSPAREVNSTLLSFFRAKSITNTSLYSILLDITNDEVMDRFETDSSELLVNIEFHYLANNLELFDVKYYSTLSINQSFQTIDLQKWKGNAVYFLIKQWARIKGTSLTEAFDSIKDKVINEERFSGLRKLQEVLTDFEQTNYFTLEEDAYSKVVKELNILDEMAQSPGNVVKEFMLKMKFNDQLLNKVKNYFEKQQLQLEPIALTFVNDSLLPEIKKGEQLYIYNAGLALIWPFVGTLFTKLGYIKDKQFTDKSKQFRAVHLLQYIIDGGDTSPEFVLVFNKLICGMPLSDPLDMFVTLTDEEKKEADQFLESIKNKWKEMKNTSLATFRDSFLKREGTLTFDEKNWKLKVESKPIDVLLRKLPWGFSLIKFHWIDYIIFVEWTTKN